MCLIFNSFSENSFLEFFFGPYLAYSTQHIILESTAVVFGIASVLYSRINHIWVYPTGLISTAIYVYLLWQFELLGDMLINAYYFTMSLYGWYYWSRKENGKEIHLVSNANGKVRQHAIFLFLATLLFVALVYTFFNKWNSFTAVIDTFTTGIFFVGMWLMAKRKIEHWLCWIIGNTISIPLYFYKGLTLSSFQYVIFTILAILGYWQWKRHYINKVAIV